MFKVVSLLKFLFSISNHSERDTTLPSAVVLVAYNKLPEGKLENPSSKFGTIHQEFYLKEEAKSLTQPKIKKLSDFGARKAVGGSTGAKKASYKDGTTFFIKGKVIESPEEPENCIPYKIELFREFVASAFFTKFLGETRSAKVELIQDDVKIQNKVEIRGFYIGSKLVDTFSTFSEFKKKYPEKISQVKGLEEILAISLFVGDLDYHDENLGVVNLGTEEKPDLYFAKIDYGKALLNAYDNGTSFIQTLHEDFFPEKALQVNRKEFSGVEFSAQKFQEALIRLKSIFPPNEIKEIIDHKISTLEKLGFKHDDPIYFKKNRTALDHSYLQSIVYENKKKDDLHLEYARPQKTIANKYAENTITHLNIFEDLSGNFFQVIKEIDVHDKWKKLGWLKDLYNPTKNIVLKNPLVWAVENKQLVGGYDPMDWAEKHDTMIYGMTIGNWIKFYTNSTSEMDWDSSSSEDRDSLSADSSTEKDLDALIIDPNVDSFGGNFSYDTSVCSGDVYF